MLTIIDRNGIKRCRHLFSFYNNIHFPQVGFTKRISKLSIPSSLRKKQLSRLLTGQVSGKLVKQSSQLPFYKVQCQSNNRINVIQRLILFGKGSSVISKVHKYVSTMTTKISDLEICKVPILAPPSAVRGMTVLDRSVFQKKIQIPAVKVPVKNIGKLQKSMSKCLLKSFVRIKPVVDLADDDPQRNDYKLFLLDAEKYPTFESLDESLIERLKANGVDMSSVHYYELDVTYENWPASDIMRAVLPEQYDTVSSFCVIGHIAHLNLKDEILQYKNVIGEVILDKVSAVKTVVNKLNTIDNTYRNFNMELLAGVENYVAIAKENGCSFQMDFSKVYWNPRLVSEHAIVISSLNKGSILYDVFAGVGPFGIPAAKKGVCVLANDLNPHSFKWLEENVKANKIQDGLVQTFNMDGREFIKTILAKDLTEQWQKTTSDNLSVSIVMNLPALAIEFLDAFRNVIDKSQLTGHVKLESLALPKVYCYCFTKSDDPEGNIRERAEASLGTPLPDDHTIRHVRNVAPNKEMYCLSFTVPGHVLWAAESRTDGSPERKKLKLEETVVECSIDITEPCIK